MRDRQVATDVGGIIRFFEDLIHADELFRRSHFQSSKIIRILKLKIIFIGLKVIELLS